VLSELLDGFSVRYVHVSLWHGSDFDDLVRTLLEPPSERVAYEFAVFGFTKKLHDFGYGAVVRVGEWLLGHSEVEV
jgi:hypothetical protein